MKNYGFPGTIAADTFVLSEICEKSGPCLEITYGAQDSTDTETDLPSANGSQNELRSPRLRMPYLHMHSTMKVTPDRPLLHGRSSFSMTADFENVDILQRFADVEHCQQAHTRIVITSLCRQKIQSSRLEPGLAKCKDLDKDCTKEPCRKVGPTTLTDKIFCISKK